MKQVITIPNEVLRQKCEKVTKITPKIKSFAKEMVEFLEVHKADKTFPVGLSAPQLGMSIRMFAFRNNPLAFNEGDIQVVINPEIVYAKGLHLVKESCLSIPGKTFNLKRHKLVKIRGLILNGSIRSFRGRDILAQVFEHELNHLDGLLLDVVGRLLSVEGDITMQEYSNNPTCSEGDAYDPNYIPSGRDEPATDRQRLIITRLCMAKGIKEPLEEKPMTIGEAGRLIRELQSKRGQGG